MAPNGFEGQNLPRHEKGNGSAGLGSPEKLLERQMVALMPNLKAFATSLCKDPVRAEDMAQQTFLKAWEHRDSFAFGTNLRAWMFTILRNTYFTEQKRKRREIEAKDGNIEAVSDTRVSQLPNAPGRVDLFETRAAMQTIPADQREALMLQSAGFSHEEIAEIQHVAVGTVKSRVQRARKILGDQLGLSLTTPLRAPRKERGMYDDFDLEPGTFSQYMESLSERQRAVVEALIVQKKPRGAVALELGITNQSLSSYLAAAREKLGKFSASKPI